MLACLAILSLPNAVHLAALTFLVMSCLLEHIRLVSFIVSNCGSSEIIFCLIFYGGRRNNAVAYRKVFVDAFEDNFFKKIAKIKRFQQSGK